MKDAHFSLRCKIVDAVKGDAAFANNASHMILGEVVLKIAALINHDVYRVFTSGVVNQTTSAYETSWDDVRKSLEESLPSTESNQHLYGEYRRNAIDSMLKALKAYADSEVDAQIKALGSSYGATVKLRLDENLKNLRFQREQEGQKRG